MWQGLIPGSSVDGVSGQRSSVAGAEGRGGGLGRPPRSRGKHPGVSQGSLWPELCCSRGVPWATARGWGGVL